MRPTRFAILVLGALLFGGSTYWMLPSQHVHVYNNNNNKPPPPPPRNGTTATPTVALALDPATGAHQALVQLRLHNCNFLTTPSLPTTTPASCLTSESCHINEFCHHELHTCNTICKPPRRTRPTPPQLIPHDDDVFIVSFPKSGSTWVRHLITNLQLHLTSSTTPPKPSTFEHVDQTIPFLEDKASGNRKTLFTTATGGGEGATAFPRMFKTHQPWQCDGPPCRGWVVGSQAKWQCACPMCASKFKRVIYIVRDGRAAMFSYYQFQKELKLRGRTKTFDMFLRYRKRRYPGVSWSDHVRTWLAAPRVDMLWIKYEDLKTQPEQELSRIAQFLNVDANAEAIRWSVQASSREAMRNTERETGAGIFTKKYKKRDRRFRMVHEGGTKKWRQHFTEDHAGNEQLWSQQAGYMNRCLGY